MTARLHMRGWSVLAGGYVALAVVLSVTQRWWLAASWLVLGFATAALVAAAGWLFPAADRLAWLVLGGAAGVFTLADLAFGLHPLPPVRWGDALYVPAYALAAVGLRLLARDAGRGGGLWETAAMAAGLVALLVPVAFGHDVTDKGRLLGLLYPLANLVLLTLALEAAGAISSASAWLLAAGTMWLLASSFIISAVGYSVTLWVVPLRAGYLCCWGLAALWPPQSGPDGTRTGTGPAAPVGLFTLVVLVVPAALLTRAGLDRDPRATVLGLACAAAGLFVVARLREAAHAVRTDPVTGLPWLPVAVAHTAAAMAAGRDPQVFLVDVREFHQVNELLGRRGGDRALAALARRLRTVAEPAQVARSAADRFVVTAEHAEASADPAGYAETLITAVCTPLEARGTRLHLDCAVGYARAGDAPDAEELLVNADMALRAAKRAGPGSRSLPYDLALRAAETERASLTGELPEAIAAGQFYLEYQPIVDLADDTIAGFEALVRWHHPRLGRLGPDRFVPLAESGGVIGELGAWIMTGALEGAARLNAAAGRRLFMDVNVSPVQLEPERTAELGRIIADRPASLDAALIVLEVTESVLIEDQRGVIEQLAALKTTGVRLAVDDFGTGYSSLGRLRDLPIDIIKIDRVFVTDLRPGPSTQMMSGVLQIIASLGLDAVAEGVETREERDRLRELGCHFAQGYFYFKPLDLDSALDAVSRPTRR